MYLTIYVVYFLVGLTQAQDKAISDAIGANLYRNISNCQLEDKFIRATIKSLVDIHDDIKECWDGIRNCFEIDESEDENLLKNITKSFDDCDKQAIYNVLKELLAIRKQYLNSCHLNFQDCRFYRPTIIEGNSYYLSKYHADGFDKAMKYCRGIGGYLAELDSFSEMRKSQEYVKSLRAFGVFIAGSDASKEASWVFPKTGKKMEVFDWSQNEPNNVDGNEHCLVLWVFNEGKMNDIRCNYSDSNYKYLCEVEP